MFNLGNGSNPLSVIFEMKGSAVLPFSVPKEAKTQMKATIQSLLALMITLALISYACFAQSKGSGSGGSSGGGGQGNQGGQSAPSTSGQGGSNSAGANRIEATMLAYDASNEIAKAIKPFVNDHNLFVYDSQAFGSLQTYDAYVAAVSTLEADFNLIKEQVLAAKERIRQGEDSIENIDQQIKAVTKKTIDVSKETQPLTSVHLELDEDQFNKFTQAQIAAAKANPETNPPTSSFTAATGAVQTVLGILGSIRSTSEYAGEAVDFSVDAVIAQLVAQKLSGKVIVPKMILLSAVDLRLPAELSSSNCSDIEKTVPHQLGCLTKLRNQVATFGDVSAVNLTPVSNQEAGKGGTTSSIRTISYLSSQAEKLVSDARNVSVRAKTAKDQADTVVSAARAAMSRAKDQAKIAKLKQDTDDLATIADRAVIEAERSIDLANRALLAANEGTNAFAPIDKVFQAFFAGLMGALVSSTTNSGQDKIGGTSASQSSPSQTGNLGGGSSNPAPAGSGLSSVVQGHRLRQQLADQKSRILVLEAIAAGGGQRIKHNFFVEVFYTTPTPTFTGGAIVTYMLIDPCDSRVVSANVFRFIYNYGKFHGTKSEKANNF